jgi:hypothetical protein
MAHNDDKQRLFQPTNFSGINAGFKKELAQKTFCDKAEKLVVAKLQKKRADGIRIVESSLTDFAAKEDNKSSTLLYSGKVTVVATFTEGRLIKRADLSVALVDNDLVINDKVLEAELKAAPFIEAAATTVKATSVKASLEDFKVVNDGTKYLKIYHSAAYGDISPIGAVSKNEYSECVNKEALLKDMFSDEAQGWPATVSFKGTFKEPTIADKVSAEVDAFKVKAWTTESPKTPEANDLASRAKSFEGTRFALEAHKKSLDDLKARITQRAIVSLTDSLRAKAASLKVKHISTDYDLETHAGKVCLEAEMMDGRDYKMVPLEVMVSESGMKLPTFEQITALLKSAKSIDREIKSTSTPSYMTADAATPVTKKADTGYQGSTMLPPDTLRMNREFLPKTLNVGDVIEVDNDNWALSSKEDDQLSTQKDSDPHWTFKRVPRAPKDDKADFKPRNQ